MDRPFRFSVTAGGITDPKELRELAVKVEDLGYSTLTIADHLDNQFAPLIALTAAAAVTSRIRLTSLVLANDYRNPVVLAKELASLDQLSDGRLEVGLGAGWMTSDYEQTGISHDSAGTRIARLEEAVQIIKGAFSGQSFDFEGEHYTIRGLLASPLPAQQPAPPLLLAGGRPKILGVAGRHADIVGLNPSLHAGVIDHRAGATATPAATDQKIDWVREAAGPRFDQIELQSRVHLAQITDDREGVAEVMAPAMGLSVDDARNSPHALVGSVDQCIETVRSWRDRWGITYVGFSADAVDQMAPVVAALSST